MRAVEAGLNGPPSLLPRRWHEPVAVLCLLLSVFVIYAARLSMQPFVGEETRWATAAREMLATGDWIVPRQQGHVFPERPPMTMWLMAIGGHLRGDVDPIAIRLPSVFAVVLTSLLIYVYTRSLVSRNSAITAALAYGTFGQVMQIGRLGESEAVFALLVSSSLLLWHLGYSRGWRPITVWTTGFACAALAALVKGPQAPVYFGAIVGVYLLVERDWRYAFRWQAFAGAAVFGIIVGAWQIPFYRATSWADVVATWAGLAADRFNLRGVLTHAFTYPLETFVCLLPWSPILVAVAHPQTRKLILGYRQVTTFLITAILVAYPTVWLAAGARGRYFMPLYPVVAVLVGVVIERCAAAAVSSYPRRAWHQFLVVWGSASAIGAGCMLVASLLPAVAEKIYQPHVFCLAFAVLAATASHALWTVYRNPKQASPLRAILAIGVLTAVGASGIMVNVNDARWHDPTATVAEFRKLLPAGENLVSFTPIEHRFAYYYGEPITELEWPRSVSDAPPDTDYFCFMRFAKDTAESRAAGRGRSWYTTPGTLPFAWEELKASSVDRRIDANAMVVVLGRVVRPVQAKVTDATKPQRATAQQSPPTQLR